MDTYASNRRTDSKNAKENSDDFFDVCFPDGTGQQASSNDAGVVPMLPRTPVRRGGGPDVLSKKSKITSSSYSSFCF